MVQFCSDFIYDVACEFQLWVLIVVHQGVGHGHVHHKALLEIMLKAVKQLYYQVIVICYTRMIVTACM